MDSFISDSDSWAPDVVGNRVELNSVNTDVSPMERTESWVENHSQAFGQKGEGEAEEERD